MKLVKSGADDVERLEQKVKDGIYRPERKRDLCDLFGIVEDQVAALQFLYENGSGWSSEEISELLGDGEGKISIEHVNNSMTWAELLGLARRGPDGWDIDAGVRQVLSLG
jgi:hypothetical protein